MFVEDQAAAFSGETGPLAGKTRTVTLTLLAQRLK
jgi:hypothetical protein